MKKFVLIVFIALYSSCTKKQSDSSPDSTAIKLQPTVSLIQPINELIFQNTLVFLEKHPDSTAYHHLAIKRTYRDTIQYHNTLQSILDSTQKYWEQLTVNKTVRINSISVGYPSAYSDILKRHIEIFQNSKEWKSYSKSTEQYKVYSLVSKIMLDEDVYKPLNDFLKSKGYLMSQIQIEKLGYVPENKKIPMPFMVWIQVKPIEN